MADKKTKKLTDAEIHDGVRGFSMVLRESIMDYYKGSCIQSFGSLSQYHVGRHPIPLQNDGSRRSFNYERQEHERRNPIAYYINDQKMFELWKDEHQAVFHPSVMRRSPYLSASYDQLHEFFNKFLAGVTIIEKDDENSSSCTDGSNDRRYIFRDMTQQTGEAKNRLPQEEEEPVFFNGSEAIRPITRSLNRYYWDNFTGGIVATTEEHLAMLRQTRQQMEEWARRTGRAQF